MVKILIKLGEYNETIVVPKNIVGFENVLDYILDTMGKKFARSTTIRQAKEGNEHYLDRINNNYWHWRYSHEPHVRANLEERIQIAKTRMGLQ